MPESPRKPCKVQRLHHLTTARSLEVSSFGLCPAPNPCICSREPVTCPLSFSGAHAKDGQQLRFKPPWYSPLLISYELLHVLAAIRNKFCPCFESLSGNQPTSALIPRRLTTDLIVAACCRRRHQRPPGAMLTRRIPEFWFSMMLCADRL